MTNYAYYPGCSLETSAKEYDTSIKASFEKMGVKLTEIPDWSCCGSSPTHKVSVDTAVAISGRNLVLASKIGDGEIVAPCASCSLNLKEAVHKLEHEGPIRKTLLNAGLEYLPGSVSVLSAVEAAHRELKAGSFEGKVVNPLTGLNVASYYGCMLVRPPKTARFDDPENPTSMDDIMEAIGAGAIEWSHKVECCGSSYILVDKDVTLKLVSKVLNSAYKAGADLIVTACPLCQQNLAMRQGLMQQNYGLKHSIPVVYFSQLVGLAMGANQKDLDLPAEVLSLIKKRQAEVKVVG